MTRFETNKFVFKKTISLHQRFKSFLHHIVSSTGSPQDANISWYITFDSSLGNHILFSASTNKTKLLIGHSKICEVKLDLFSLINNFTLRTILFSSLLISKICSIGQLFRAASVRIKTMPFVLKFLLSVVHFYLAWRVDRNSFLHLDQNSSAKCCTLLHCLLLYKSGLTNEPGGGIVTLLFIVSGCLEIMELDFVGHWLFPKLEIESLQLSQLLS